MSRLVSNVRFCALLVPPLLILSFFVAYFLLSEDSISNLFSLFCLCALGGTTSTYYRLKNLPAQSDPNQQANQIAIFQVCVAPVMAGTFATIMTISLVVEIVTEPLFPVFTTIEGIDIPKKFIDFLWKSKPIDTINSTKLCL